MQPPTVRAHLLDTIASQLLRYPADRVALAAIDGVDGAGKTMFANELAQVLRQSGRPVVRASVDGFHRPKAERYRRGRSSPEGFFDDSYDYAALKAALLDPLRDEGLAVLHDRRIPYSKANIDHLIVAPWGVFIVDAKNYKGKVETRNRGGFF